MTASPGSTVVTVNDAGNSSAMARHLAAWLGVEVLTATLSPSEESTARRYDLQIQREPERGVCLGPFGIIPGRVPFEQSECAP